MKNLILSYLLIIIFPLVSIAQSPEWFPTGAKWYYTKDDLFKINYYSLEITKDTVINGKNAHTMVHKEHDAVQDSLITRDTYYVYKEDQKIYAYYYNHNYMDSTELCLIYDFSLEKGDSFRNECAGVTIHIDSVYQTEINGHSLKTYDYNAPAMVTDFTGTVYEFIGHQKFFFVDHNANGLRCFDGPVIGHYNTEIEENCDTAYISVGINEQEQKPVKIYPNPVEDVAYLQWPGHVSEEMELRVTDINGSLVRQKTQMAGQQVKIELSHLPAGIYLVQLRNGKGEVIGTTKIVKQ